MVQAGCLEKSQNVSAAATDSCSSDVKRAQNYEAASPVSSRALRGAPGARTRGRMARGYTHATGHANTNGSYWGLRCVDRCAWWRIELPSVGAAELPLPQFPAMLSHHGAAEAVTNNARETRLCLLVQSRLIIIRSGRFSRSSPSS
jgi:hypothetical protein